jgi:hypothetical protein
MNKSSKFSPEVRERDVRMVQEQRDQYPSLWAAIGSIAAKIGCVPQTLNESPGSSLALPHASPGSSLGNWGEVLNCHMGKVVSWTTCTVRTDTYWDTTSQDRSHRYRMANPQPLASSTNPGNEVATFAQSSMITPPDATSPPCSKPFWLEPRARPSL